MWRYCRKFAKYGFISFSCADLLLFISNEKKYRLCQSLAWWILFDFCSMETNNRELVADGAECFNHPKDMYWKMLKVYKIVCPWEICFQNYCRVCSQLTKTIKCRWDWEMFGAVLAWWNTPKVNRLSYRPNNHTIIISLVKRAQIVLPNFWGYGIKHFKYSKFLR